MLTIYGVHTSRASRNIWLCYELGVPFRQVPVVQAYRLTSRAPGDMPFNTRSPEFLAVNPAGLIPAVDDDGLVLTESLAINLYLARKHGGPLAPATLAEEGQMMMWTFFAATDMEKSTLDILMHRVSRPEAERDAAIADAAEAALVSKFALLDAALAKTGWLVGGRFTVADLNVAEVVRYAMAAPRLFERSSNVKRWLEACHTRPAFKKMWDERSREQI